jgi:hypothetical protein
MTNPPTHPTPGERRTIEAVASCHRSLYEGEPQYLVPCGGRVATCRALETQGILTHCDDVGEDPERLRRGYTFTEAGKALCRALGIPLECPCETDVEDPGPHIANCPWADPNYDGGGF